MRFIFCLEILVIFLQRLHISVVKALFLQALSLGGATAGSLGETRDPLKPKAAPFFSLMYIY